MAPKSQGDDEGAAASRRRYSANPDEAGVTPGASDTQDGPADFGAFVSRSVRSSADRFKGVRSQDGTAGPTAPPTPIARRPAPRRDRPSRYWRDSLREKTGEEISVTGSASRRFLGHQYDEPRTDDGDNGDDGGHGGWWQGLASGDGEGPNRSLIGSIVLGLLLVIILILVLTRVLGDDDPQSDAAPTETPVPTRIVGPGSGTDATSEPGAQPTETPAGDSGDTPEIRRGGDNQLDNDDADSTPGAGIGEDGDVALGSTDFPEGSAAGRCPDQCLVRIQDDNIARLMKETGNRPSFSGEGIAWVVATPEQIARLDQDAEVEFVHDDQETLYLYVVAVPQGEDPALVSEYGEILDEAGPYRLVEFQEVPARVTTLVNQGYSVSKVAPAQSGPGIAKREKLSLKDADPGALMGEVSVSNISRIISDLQQSGASDGSAFGTRYYASAGNQKAADYLYRELESYGLSVWYEDFLTPEGILLVNVVAEIPGRDPGAVYVVLAHLDSMNDDDPFVAPGADDNASGMAVSLETARILAGYDLQHPVRFVFTNAEEVGILGAGAWARAANANGIRIDGVLNVDSVGSARQGSFVVMNSDASSQWLQDVLIENNARYGLGQEILSRQNPGIVADDNIVREHGIDAVLISRELYGWTPIHHSADDVAEIISVDNVVSMTYLVLLSLAELAQ